MEEEHQMWVLFICFTFYIVSIIFRICWNNNTFLTVERWNHWTYFIFRLLQKFIWIVLLTFLHSVQQPVVFERINWLENQCMLAKEYMITLLLIMRFSTISKFVYFWNPWWYSIIAIEFFWKKRLAGGIIYFHRTNQGSFNI